MFPTGTVYFGPWAIDDIQDEGKSYAVTATDMQWNPDGLTFYTVNGTTITEHSVTTAWDISTASTTGNTISITPQAGSDCKAIRFSDDGMKVFTLGGAYYVEEHALSSAYGGTATYTDRSAEIPDWGFDWFTFSKDGTVIIGGWDQTNDLETTTLSTAYDISTMGTWADVDLLDAGYRGGEFFFDDDTRLLLVPADDNDDPTRLVYVELSGSAVFTSPTYDHTSDNFDAADYGYDMEGITIGNSGRNLYIRDGGTYRQFSMEG